MDAQVLQAFDVYMLAPSAKTFDLLRQTFINSPAYDPYGSDLEEIYSLVDAGKFVSALNNLMALMPNWFLNPRAHILASVLHHKLGDEPAARMEAELSKLILEGILSTGDGSREQPFQVTRTDDEYDVIEFFGKKFGSQALIKEADRSFDNLTCEDGTTVWFNVTDLLASLEKKI
ncbi:MAG: DUF4919 domain-containing protein [Acidobacteria bacterium]|nr:DUF4919 domain-containing protein [Acidobacteriota bacterium]